MDLGQIEENVEALDPSKGFDFVYDLLAAYGFPKATIARLKKGTGTVAPSDRERLLKNKLYYRFLEEWETNEDIHAVIDDAASDDTIAKQMPRFLIVRDKDTLVAMDRSTGETLDVPIEKLHLHASFFLPWAGVEKVDLETAHYADIKAAEKMARLYDEIQKVNEIESDDERHALNVFFTRLLFCFFAEDTGIFEAGQVTKAIGSLTQPDGSDLHTFLDQLFEVLDTPMRDRGDLPSYLRDFGYVNGSLFGHRTRVPEFSAKARAIILECSELDWSEINPDIFGSMMQAVVHSDQRAGLGMHYTSVENIMKVLRPLFLDELGEAYEAAEDDARKLRKLHDRISAIKVFDPACGSGNFLVIAYKELRKLEHRILERLRELEADPKGSGLFEESRVSLVNFYGIEIDDFAHEIARLSLWLAKHQTNKQFEELFGSRLQTIPLVEAGNVTAGNAARTSWSHVLADASGSEVFVCGNPPYAGKAKQTLSQKDDFSFYFSHQAYSKNLDYISLWFLRGADFLVEAEQRAKVARIAFVSTNSICQGDHVGLLFPSLFEKGCEIAFAHEPFRWGNLARKKATVSCVIVGLSRPPISQKYLYTTDGRLAVENIDPYLRNTAQGVVVVKRRKPISNLPVIQAGCMPRDDGALCLDADEVSALLAESPNASRFVREFRGTDAILHGKSRYCIWIPDQDLDDALRVPKLVERIDRVRAFRLRSSNPDTRKHASSPHRFVEIRHSDSPVIVVPEISSGNRHYIPVSVLDGSTTVLSNKCLVIHQFIPWVFGLLQSRMHRVWAAAVGGRLGTDFSYSPGLVYNTFPVPELTDEDQTALTDSAFAVLGARQQFPDRTLAELYDPDKMPAPLRNAHLELDDVVDRIYSPTGFASDDERLAKLFEMYEEMTSKQEELHA